MTIHYNVPGKKRKELAETIGAWLGVDIRYCGAPTFAYEIDRFTIDKDGNLTFSDCADSEVIERLLEYLYDNSFECDISETLPPIDAPEVEEDCPPPCATPQNTANVGASVLCVSMPKAAFDERTLANLGALVASKANLIGKAFGISEVALEITEDKVCFPWLTGEPTPEEIRAFDAFVCKLGEMTRTQHRITAKEKEVDNEKYAFRCFLLRLGFIGDEYKLFRKILLRKLTGSSAFKGGAKNAVSE